MGFVASPLASINHQAGARTHHQRQVNASRQAKEGLLMAAKGQKDGAKNAFK